jgi:hypothetical protein
MQVPYYIRNSLLIKIPEGRDSEMPSNEETDVWDEDVDNGIQKKL